MNLPEPVGEAALAFFQKLLGPVGEASEILSDKVRLYRWKSALKTLEKAKEIARKHKLPVNEVPIKFLVPFMEKSSLEEDSDELTTRWANLLVAASQEYTPEKLAFVDILSKISAAEARLLERMTPRQFVLEGGNLPDHAEFSKRAESLNGAVALMAGLVSAPNFDQGKSQDRARSVVRGMIGSLSVAYVEYVVVEPIDINSNSGWSEANEEADADVLSLDILVSLGLASRSKISRATRDVSVTASIVRATALGYEFVRACRGAEPAEEATK